MRVTTFVIFIYFSGLHFLFSQTCITGSVTFNTQAEVNSFVSTYSSSGCKSIGGDLRISGTGLSLTGLSFLDTIKGILRLEPTGATAISVNLTGLTGLDKINGLKVRKITNSSLTTINISSFSGYIEIRDCDNLQQFNFIPAAVLTNTVSSMIISNCPVLFGLTSLNSLQVCSSFQLSNTGIINYTLPASFHTATTSFYISGNQGLVTLSIPNTNFTTPTLTMTNNKKATTFSLNIGTSENITINDSLNSLTILNPSATQNFDILSLKLPKMTSLAFLSNVNTVKDLRIEFNGTTLNELTNIDSLEKLTLENCPNLTTFGGLHPDIFHLNTLKIQNCASLLNMAGFSQISQIGYLNYQNIGFGSLMLTNNALLNSVQQLNTFDIYSATVTGNPNLNFCCRLNSISWPQYSNISNNGTPCNSFTNLATYCVDSDQDGIINYFDNCPTNANINQLDTDQDGVGDVCDACPIPINLTFSTQTEINNFFSNPTNYSGCILNNVYLEGSTIVDLRGFRHFKKVNGNLSLVESENLQSLDGLDSIRYIGGNFEIYVLENLADISGLSKLDSIGGNLSMVGFDLLQSIQPLENLKKVVGTIDISNGQKLTECCCMYPFFINQKPSAGVTLSLNASPCLNANLTSECTDTDNDGIINHDDNCKTIFNLRQDDFDHDGVGDVCDNCIENFNPDQKNTDGDNRGDVCDNCPDVNSLITTDTDNDGIGNPCEGNAGAESQFIGISIATPKSKLHVNNGDILLTNLHRGVIMKSQDGSCFRIKVNNDGTIKSVKITCP